MRHVFNHKDAQLLGKEVGELNFTSEGDLKEFLDKKGFNRAEVVHIEVRGIPKYIIKVQGFKLPVERGEFFSFKT